MEYVPKKMRTKAPETLAERFHRLCIGARDVNQTDDEQERQLFDLAIEHLPIYLTGFDGSRMPVTDIGEKSVFLRRIYGNDLCRAISRYLASERPTEMAGMVPRLPRDVWKLITLKNLQMHGRQASTALRSTSRAHNQIQIELDDEIVRDYLQTLLPIIHRWRSEGGSALTIELKCSPYPRGAKCIEDEYFRISFVYGDGVWSATLRNGSKPLRDMIEFQMKYPAVQVGLDEGEQESRVILSDKDIGVYLAYFMGTYPDANLNVLPLAYNLEGSEDGNMFLYTLRIAQDYSVGGYTYSKNDLLRASDVGGILANYS